MCDIANEAFEREEWERELALKNRKKPEPPSAVCRNGDCGEPSQPGANYCCPECREDDEKWVRANQQRRVA